MKELLSDSLLNNTQILKVKIGIFGDCYLAKFNSVCDPGHCKFFFQMMSSASRQEIEIGEESEYMSNLEIMLEYYFIQFLIQIKKTGEDGELTTVIHTAVMEKGNRKYVCRL